jgi:hypothetical protein
MQNRIMKNRFNFFLMELLKNKSKLSSILVVVVVNIVTKFIVLLFGEI